MAKNKAALDALEALLSGARRVDLGDMTRPVTAARREALEAMLPKADDWGWKGGKEGEVTAGSLRYDYEDLGKLGRQILESESPLGKAAREVRRKGTGVEDPWQVGAHYIDTLSSLEAEDVPREWTGKIAAVANDLIRGSGGGAQRAQMLLQNPRDFYAYKQLPARLSRAMRKMTNDQRETFLALLPEWTGSLDELAEAARSL